MWHNIQIVVGYPHGGYGRNNYANNNNNNNYQRQNVIVSMYNYNNLRSNMAPMGQIPNRVGGFNNVFPNVNVAKQLAATTAVTATPMGNITITQIVISTMTIT